ncbi:MAG TPA: hypothetical protein VFF73_41160 [Planctomycetota bacterium]|nr:hypothetical protein [Planctomycetota bacterium]
MSDHTASEEDVNPERLADLCRRADEAIAHSLETRRSMPPPRPALAPSKPAEVRAARRPTKKPKNTG